VRFASSRKKGGWGRKRTEGAGGLSPAAGGERAFFSSLRSLQEGRKGKNNIGLRLLILEKKGKEKG